MDEVALPWPEYVEAVHAARRNDQRDVVSILSPRHRSVLNMEQVVALAERMRSDGYLALADTLRGLEPRMLDDGVSWVAVPAA